VIPLSYPGAEAALANLGDNTATITVSTRGMTGTLVTGEVDAVVFGYIDRVINFSGRDKSTRVESIASRMAKLRLQPRTELNRRPDAMRKKRRNGRVSTKTCVKDEIAHLRGLDLKGLRARWQSVFQRSAPAHLTRHLLFAVIAYRLQADRFGDLDHGTMQVLDRSVAKEEGPTMSTRLASFDQKRTELTPGTVLVRGSGIDSHSG
jgi:hypothetical protein